MKDPRMRRKWHLGDVLEGLRGDFGGQGENLLWSGDLTGSRLGKGDDVGFKAGQLGSGGVHISQS